MERKTSRKQTFQVHIQATTLSLPLPCDAITTVISLQLHYNVAADYAHPVWSFHAQVVNQKNLAVGVVASVSSCFKTKSPVLETGLVSRTGLCNPRETSRFAFRTTTKIPTRRWKNPSGMPEGLPSGRRLNESPRPKAGKWAFSQSIHPAEPSLNESPRPKVGKFGNLPSDYRCTGRASMKVPARRRGSGFVKRTV